MKNLIKKLKNFHKDENGDVVQVAIVTSIFAVLAVGGYMFLKPLIEDMFDKAGEELDKANAATYE